MRSILADPDRPCLDPRCAACQAVRSPDAVRPRWPEQPCLAYVLQRDAEGGSTATPCGATTDLTMGSGEPRCLAHASRATLWRRLSALCSLLALPVPPFGLPAAVLRFRIRALRALLPGEPLPTGPTCRTCARPIKTPAGHGNGECGTCYVYRSRHGTSRAEALAPRFCQECGAVIPRGHFFQRNRRCALCRACYQRQWRAAQKASEQ